MPSTVHKQPSLTQLVRKLLFYFALALFGSWGLIVPRLFIFHLSPERQASHVWLYIDLASLALVIFGVFMVFYSNSLLTPRLKRLTDLGESQW
ncbi:MAG: hypothetical protein LBP22_05975 [Deltaproteobacteria bacterium]|jgi:hypothetical protein|nr:hypothetical protein [Deltaproteobacteria bacterium]